MSNENNNNNSVSPTYALAGAVCGGAAIGAACSLALMMVVSKRVSISSSAATAALNEGVIAKLLSDYSANLRRDLSKEVQDGMADMTSRFGTTVTNNYQQIQDRLQPIQGAHTELQTMNRRLESVEQVFHSPQKRGVFGELCLETLISDIFPASSYSLQAKLSNGKRPDCLLRLPQPVGNLCIDSKFPLDAFTELRKLTTDMDQNTGTLQRPSHNNTTAVKEGRKKVEDSLRKHISDIANKYILPGETADCAILFLPSAGLFVQVIEDFPAIYQEANQKKVWIACPTTLLAVLTTLRGVVRGIQMTEQSQDLMQHVHLLIKDVDRLVARMDKAQKTVDTAQENLRQCQVSIAKIQRQRLKLDLMDPTAQIGNSDYESLESHKNDETKLDSSDTCMEERTTVHHNEPFISLDKIGSVETMGRSSLKQVA